jgi:hypothetical protein
MMGMASTGKYENPRNEKEMRDAYARKMGKYPPM